MGSFFYTVAPSDKSYHSSELLTYESDDKLEIGSIVKFEIRKKTLLGFVVSTTPKPSFATKKLIPTTFCLPKTSVKLFEWMLEYYPSPIGTVAQHFLPITRMIDADNRGKTGVVIKTDTVIPTPLQKKVIDRIKVSEKKTFIVHGETGSGKTKVYIELAKKVLEKQQSVLILVPEISLSPQINNEFKKLFGDIVQVTHSGLTTKQRETVWDSVLSDKAPGIIIGPRSALFLPYKTLGLVVVDEFHEGAYKQESIPFYNSLRVAGKLSDIHGCPLVLGSATPPISEYHWAEQKNVAILKLPKIAEHENAEVTVSLVDLSKSEERSDHSLLSQTLISNIKDTLARKEQVLLFLNKRGSSRVIVCQDCGWRSVCERCDLPFTYHSDSHKLVCHTCGNTQMPPTSCQNCGSTQILFKSPGTKSVTMSAQKLFPGVTVARFDKDNRKAERLDMRHKEVLDGDIDILVGTQVLAKGHDLPKLGMVGILQAEASLQFPDYSSNERSYQLIHQLAGRVGRGHRPGRVVIQSFTPNNPTLTDAVGNNWDHFYEKELEERRLFGFPPFFHIMKIEAARSTSEKAKNALKKITDELPEKTIFVGPSPSFIEKRSNKYHWQLIIKSKNRASLVEIAKGIPSNFTINLDPTHLL